MAFFVASGTALSIISCISAMDSSPNLLFSSVVFVDETFHIRSNAGIMADNRDLVNQSES